MNLDIVESIEGVPVRLTDTQWEHIVDRHPFLSGYYDAILDAVAEPEFILRGHRGAKTAVVNLGKRRWLHVTYRELKGKKDGFIITAYIDDEYDGKLVIWRR